MRTPDGERGQALPLVLALAVVCVLAGCLVFTAGWVHVAQARAQTGADAAALAGARSLRVQLDRIVGEGPPAPVQWRVEALRRAASRAARAAGARLVRLGVDGRWPPTSVDVRVEARGPMGVAVPGAARAGIVPGGTAVPDTGSVARGGGYGGPLAFRDGKPMCPAVAAAFDRMDTAAHLDGLDLVVVSGYRSDAEQAALFRRHPDPRWVAPPGRSRHRDGTELDLGGGGGAWGWLARRARDFGFLQRYAWEPWHYGYLAGCGPPPGDDQGAEPGLPAWVPAPYRPLVRTAAVAGGVPTVVLAAMIQAESGWNRWAVSPVGALGIAQFMPATARGVGLADPFDPDQAVPAAARLLGAHLRAFGSIALALAAYNAGAGAVTRFGGVPPFAETRAYVARILALAGDPEIASAAGPSGGVALERLGAALV
ncbi:MAG TPA: transglycosylase SLT domain-containing protein [Miltoncostaeaceae bacterium]|nr:transglycosylase SLT domain-containing protein [Miltoncostaeaceae bacterium]